MDERTLPLPLTVFTHRHLADRQYLRQYPTIGHTMSDTTTVTPADTHYGEPYVPGTSASYRHPVYGNAADFTSFLRQGFDTPTAIWDEAHAENARRSAPSTLVESVDLAWDLADAEQTVRNLRAEVGRLSAELTDERTRQIDGSDYRLTSFWERAGELADEAGHCQVYDELAEALGGQARQQDYDITVTYRYSVSLTKSEADEFDLYEYDPAEYDTDPDVRVERS